MQEEYLDIVDEKGNPTGEKELRTVIHEKGLWHWVAPVYIYRIHKNKLEFLVQLRSKNKDQYPNKWQERFGGHVTSGSTTKKTAIEEIKEEIGISINPKKLLEGIVFSYDSYKENDPVSNREFVQAYYYYFDKDLNSLFFNDGEVQMVKWMSVSEMTESIKSNPEIWANKKTISDNIIKDLQNKLKKETS